jgi:hypothetical protein
MANATLTLSGSVGGLPTGSKSITVPQIVSNSAVGQITDLSLSTGNNVISVPGGATAAIILLPVGNTQMVTLKGAGGDTGIALRGTTWSVLSLDPTQTSFILNAAGAVTGVEISFI